jgi:hypothetical protein
MNRERVRKRILRLKHHIKGLKAAGVDASSFETELSHLITGKRKPAGTNINPKVVTRSVRVKKGR